MVRLKFTNSNYISSIKKFQFHYGSIKIVFACNTSMLFQTVFQFHYGSIKIVQREENFTPVLKFQFHYGSIKIPPMSRRGRGG